MYYSALSVVYFQKGRKFTVDCQKSSSAMSSRHTEPSLGIHLTFFVKEYNVRVAETENIQQFNHRTYAQITCKIYKFNKSTLDQLHHAARQCPPMKYNQSPDHNTIEHVFRLLKRILKWETPKTNKNWKRLQYKSGKASWEYNSFFMWVGY